MICEILRLASKSIFSAYFGSNDGTILPIAFS